MASPTTQKGFTYSVHGGSVNSWDTQLNADIEELDTLLGGTLSIALAAANVVLTVAQSQNLNYQLTGVLAANVSIQWPAVGGFYIVDNQTTGAFTVTLQTAGAATTTVAPQGYRIFVWSNGPDMLPAATAVPGAYSVGGALAVGGVPSFASTSHALIPSGTTAQRPGVPAAGNFRYNSTLGLLEFYDGTSWNQPSNAQPIAGGFKNLVVRNNVATPNTQMDIDADNVTVETSGGVAYRLSSVNLTINFSATGANALDTGAIAASTWYSIWVIYNPSTATTAGLGSLQATANATFLANLPAGYTAYARVGWNRTTGTSQFNRILQYGRRTQYTVVTGSVTPNLPIIISGIQGNIGPPTWVAASVSNFVPTTASKILISMISSSGGTTLVAPNNSYGTYTSATNPVPFFLSLTTTGAIFVELILESTNVYYVSNTNLPSGLWCFGWEDNI